MQGESLKTCCGKLKDFVGKISYFVSGYNEENPLYVRIKPMFVIHSSGVKDYAYSGEFGFCPFCGKRLEKKG